MSRGFVREKGKGERGVKGILGRGKGDFGRKKGIWVDLWRRKGDFGRRKGVKEFARIKKHNQRD